MVTFSTNDFQTTTESFPPAFAGSPLATMNSGYFDPVWPPGYPNAWVNLGWFYSWFTPPSPSWIC